MTLKPSQIVNIILKLNQALYTLITSPITVRVRKKYKKKFKAIIFLLLIFLRERS